MLLQTSGYNKENRQYGSSRWRRHSPRKAGNYRAYLHLRRGQDPCSSETLAETGISPDTRVKDLTDAELVQLRDYIEGNYKVEGDLRREVAADIRRKVEIGSYEGIRHRRGLPVRGQRTKTNARTRKGPKRTVAGKKKTR